MSAVPCPRSVRLALNVRPQQVTYQLLAAAVMNGDYPQELADALALVTFGRGAWVERADGKYVVARYREECNEAVRLAGSFSRAVLGEGRTRREAIENGQQRAER